MAPSSSRRGIPYCSSVWMPEGSSTTTSAYARFFSWTACRRPEPSWDSILKSLRLLPSTWPFGIPLISAYAAFATVIRNCGSTTRMGIGFSWMIVSDRCRRAPAASRRFWRSCFSSSFFASSALIEAARGRNSSGTPARSILAESSPPIPERSAASIAPGSTTGPRSCPVVPGTTGPVNSAFLPGLSIIITLPFHTFRPVQGAQLLLPGIPFRRRSRARSGRLAIPSAASRRLQVSKGLRTPV